MGKDLKGKELGTGISQLKDGRYSGRYTNRYGRRMPPIYSWELKEVKEKLRKAQYEDDLGKTQIIHKSATVEDAYLLWIAQKKRNVRTTTLCRYQSNYKTYISQYGYCRITDINAAFIDNFIQDLVDKGLSPGTIQIAKVAFSGIMKCAVNHEMRLDNPFDRYELPKPIRDEAKKRKLQRKETHYLNEKQRVFFLQYINTHRCHQRDVYKFLMCTGLRISEGLALKWEHIDLDSQIIFIQEAYTRYWSDGEKKENYNSLTKTPYSTAKIPICNEAREILRSIQYQNKRTSGFVFLNTKGNPMSYGVFINNLRSMVKRINKRYPNSPLPEITPHWFRHTFATVCLEKGVNIKAVQYYLRHAKLSLTADLYSHEHQDFAISEMAKLNEIGTKLAQNNQPPLKNGLNTGVVNTL